MVGFDIVRCYRARYWAAATEHGRSKHNLHKQGHWQDRSNDKHSYFAQTNSFVIVACNMSTIDAFTRVVEFEYIMQPPGNNSETFRIALACRGISSPFGNISFRDRQNRWSPWHGIWFVQGTTIYMRFHFGGRTERLKLAVVTQFERTATFLGIDYEGRSVMLKFRRTYRQASSGRLHGVDYESHLFLAWMADFSDTTFLVDGSEWQLL